jgi:hypothetical protein
MGISNRWCQNGRSFSEAERDALEACLKLVVGHDHRVALDWLR